ncbi:MAG TPA: DUF6789 family protein [Bryobacteraceae bacterium]
MGPATENRSASTISALLAGLQAGMLGVCWMLAWLGVSAEWQLRSFWTAENLMASAFYGERAIRSGFAVRTVSGLALYLLLYSLLGGLFAAVLGDRIPRLRLMLLGILFALCWYFISFRLLWKSMMPLVALLHSAQPTAVGHLIYGTLLGRYSVYLPQRAKPEAEGPAPEAAAPETAAEEPTHPEVPE